jgi:hypothetical protein
MAGSLTETSMMVASADRAAFHERVFTLMEETILTDGTGKMDKCLIN